MSLLLKKLNLEFRETGHTHILNGSEVPGCTSVSGLFQDDGWKFAWPVKLMQKKILEGLLEMASRPSDISKMEYVIKLVKDSKNAWREKRDKSADSGTMAHAWIEQYIKQGQEVLFPEDKDAVAAIGQFLVWEREADPLWLASELQVGSETHGFCGILDAVAMIDDKLMLVDFKTSSGIKDDYAIQLAGLMICLEEMGCSPEARAILHIPKDGKGYEFKILDGNLEEEKKDFLAGLAFLRRKNLFKARNK